jgi:hypothetical protein
VTSPRRRSQPRTPQPAAPYIPRQLTEEDLLELRDPYGIEDLIPDRPDGGPLRPPEYTVVLCASDWVKEHFPAAAANLWDALHTSHDYHHDPEPDLEAEP